MANKNDVATLKTKVVTSAVRLSYLHAFMPTGISASTPPEQRKYSASVLIPKSNKALIKEIEDAIKNAFQLGVDSKMFNGKVTNINQLPSTFKMPLRDGDKERPGDEVYKDHMFFNCSSKTKPQVIDLSMNVLTNDDEFYSGVWSRVSVNFYPFNANGSMGIAGGLNNFQKVRDGEKLSGRPSAEQDFGDGYQGDEEEL